MNTLATTTTQKTNKDYTAELVNKIGYDIQLPTAPP